MKRLTRRQNLLCADRPVSRPRDALKLASRLPLKPLLLSAALSAAGLAAAAETNAFPELDQKASTTGIHETNRPAKWAVRLERPGLPNLYRVTMNLYRGAQPTPEGVAELKAMGIKTVVNLRSFHSDVHEFAGSGLNQARLRMKPWHIEEEDIVEFLKLATNTNNFPVFVHCQRGADRTGLACAIYRIAVCGWTKPEAIREMKEGGFGFDPAWQNILIFLERADVAKIKMQAGITSRDGNPR